MFQANAADVGFCWLYNNLLSINLLMILGTSTQGGFYFAMINSVAGKVKHKVKFAHNHIT